LELTIERIEEVLSLVRDEGCRALDLRGVRFADPYGLLLLDLLIRDQDERSEPLDVIWPTHRPVVGWMRAMGRYDGLDASRRTGGRLPDVHHALQPITPIADERAIMELVDGFDARLAERYRLDPSPRNTLIRFMIELFQNIPQHSNATGEVADPHGIAAMQDYHDGIVLAIADKGVGMRASLSLRDPGLVASDADALDAVILRGVSRFDDPGRGEELMRIFRMVRSWDGTIAVRSGSALLYHDPERGGDLYDVAPFPGLQIALCIPRRVFGIEEVDGAPEDWFNEPDE